MYRVDAPPIFDAQRRLTGALERLVQLYEATNRLDEAAKWRKKLEANKAIEKQPEKKRSARLAPGVRSQ